MTIQFFLIDKDGNETLHTVCGVTDQYQARHLIEQCRYFAWENNCRVKAVMK